MGPSYYLRRQKDKIKPLWPHRWKIPSITAKNILMAVGKKYHKYIAYN